ncbi:DUF1770-domain-containing protein [Xylariaceae sp. FL0594]|nr:DUF1770-domain-containing protein [Xylariaceae sp. FL0594]
MASSIPTQIAEMVQTAHIKREPSAAHDLNPSTAASMKEPAYIPSRSSSSSSPASTSAAATISATATTKTTTTATSSSSSRSRTHHHSHHHHHHHRHPYDDLDDIDEDEEDIPVSVLVAPRPAPRRGHRQPLPPMPDLRFEQSYLHSIAGADTWWKIAWITVRDQVMMPLAQGVLYNLAIAGWQHWNRSAQLSGNSAGARLRRWWYGVNNWPLPPSVRASMKADGRR